MGNIYEDLSFTGLSEFEINNALWRNEMAKRIQIKENVIQEDAESDAVGRLNSTPRPAQVRVQPSEGMWNEIVADERANAHYNRK